MKVVLCEKDQMVIAVFIVEDGVIIRAAKDIDLEQGEKLALIDVYPPDLERAHGYFDKLIDRTLNERMDILTN